MKHLNYAILFAVQTTTAFLIAFILLVFLTSCARSRTETNVIIADCHIKVGENGSQNVQCEDGTNLLIPPLVITNTVTNTVTVPVYIEVKKDCKPKKHNHGHDND
jgi:hypothetical protein